MAPPGGSLSDRAREREIFVRTPVFEPQGFAGTRNPTFGAPGRGALKPFFRQLTHQHPVVPMSGDPRTNADHWVAWPIRVAPSAQGDLNSTL